MPILPAAVHKTRQPADWETLYGFRVRLVCDRPPDTRSYYSSSSLSLVIRFSLALRVSKGGHHHKNFWQAARHNQHRGLRCNA